MMLVDLYQRRVVCLLLIVFFFQAEDGIRDLVRSRGLGDVYKRQSLASSPRHRGCRTDGGSPGVDIASWGQIRFAPIPVSYTHLTLPTSDLV